MRPLRSVETPSRTKLLLAGELGKGGEGIVYAVEGRSDVAAKIYFPEKAAERRDKIHAMVEARWHQAIREVAFPIEPLYDNGRAFVGFTMRKVPGKAIHQAYSPTSRKTAFPKATFPFLVRIALNIAISLAKVHSTGSVIGDINHSSVIVAEDGTVTLIDSDSFQVRSADRVFACKVGVPEFTPPELQGVALDSILRTENHDGFGLAVLIFQILFMGRHPFSGRPTALREPPEMSAAIREFRFAYSARQTGMQPPPHVPTLDDVPTRLGTLFERAFGPQGAAGSGRPAAAEWVSALDAAEKEMVRCQASPAHHHFRLARTCPWCRMEAAFPGFAAFRQTFTSLPAGGGLNVGQLIAAIQAVSDPGPAPGLAALMPRPGNLRPSSEAVRAKQEKYLRAVAAVAGVIGGLVLMAAIPGLGVLLGLGTMGAAVVFGFSTPEAAMQVRARYRAAQQEWSNVTRRWASDAGNEHYAACRRDAETLVKALQRLGEQEQKELQALELKRVEAQKRRFLESHLIMPAKIPGLGNVRKIRLQSYGIESAADVEQKAVRRVPGCASIANALTAWRRSVERRFVFNASIPVDPADVAAVKANIARQRSDLEARARAALSRLQESRTRIMACRANPGSFANVTSAWMALKQAEVDSAAL
jgi:DNA-binding helix-hairpin-helix protein with protein kinase domain